MKILISFFTLSSVLKLGEFSIFGDIKTVLDNPLCLTKWPSCGLSIPNIVCERMESCVAEEGCEAIQPDPEFLKFILHEHNRLRNEIATGKETRGGAGPAANMMALSYDKDLEYTASCNANMCKFQHDKCRGTQKFPKAGQNLFYVSGNGSELRNAVTEWFEEIKMSSAEVIDKFPRGREDIRRFAQMIASSITHMGCAQSKKHDSEEYFLVCNYGPRKPFEERKLYERGEACSQCPRDVARNSEFQGLCGPIDESQILIVSKEVQPVEKKDDKSNNADATAGEGSLAAVPEVRGDNVIEGEKGDNQPDEKKEEDNKTEQKMKDDKSNNADATAGEHSVVAVPEVRGDNVTEGEKGDNQPDEKKEEDNKTEQKLKDDKSNNADATAGEGSVVAVPEVRGDNVTEGEKGDNQPDKKKEEDNNTDQKISKENSATTQTKVESTFKTQSKTTQTVATTTKLTTKSTTESTTDEILAETASTDNSLSSIVELNTNDSSFLRKDSIVTDEPASGHLLRSSKICIFSFVLFLIKVWYIN